MALIDKASLLMVPSTYEDGTLYNVLPSGNKAPDETGNHNGYDQTRADFTFSRGSNLAATRVNSDGLIEKGRENLFTQSNNFSHSDWNVKAGTFTQGVADPDGGNNAWSWEATNTDPYLYQSGKSLNGVGTLSIWVKGVGSTIGKNFELRNASLPYKNITLTGEWQRVEHFNNTASGTSVGFEYGNPAVAGDVVHIYQAQYEVGTIATSYMDSGSTTAQAGILEDMPRINYDANGENGALLLESSRTNIFTHSEYITGFSTSNTGISIEENATTSPEGVVNAAKIKEDGTNAAHAVRQLTGPTLTSGTDYTFSFFAKKGERSIVALSNTIGSSNDANCFFDLENGQVLTNQFNSASIEDFGNGWYRCIATDTADAADDYDTRIYTATADNQFSHQGVSGSGLFIYGLQLEAGSHVSSYVPTYGSAVTRSADSCSVTGVSDVIGQTEGTIYGEIDFQQTESSARFIAIGDGTSANRIAIFTNSSNDGFRVFVNDNNSIQVDSSISVSKGIVKFALGYSNNDYALYVDGVSRITDTSASVPACSNVYLGRQEISLTNVLGSGIKQAVLFNERLSNSELADLTA